MRGAILTAVLFELIAGQVFAAGPATYPNPDGFCWDVPTAVSASGKCCQRAGTVVPDGTITVVNSCDDYKQVGIPGAAPVYWDAGVVGTADWTRRTAAGGGCNNNGVVDDPAEQCDAPGGVGAVGVCGTVANCTATCTCARPTCSSADGSDCPGGAVVMDCIANVCTPTCGNNVLDAGELCDGSAAGSPCENACSAQCDACADSVCPNGVIEPGEECEPGVSGGSGGTITFGNALRAIPVEVDLDDEGLLPQSQTETQNPAVDLLDCTQGCSAEFWMLCTTPIAGTATATGNLLSKRTGSNGWRIRYDASLRRIMVTTAGDGAETTADSTDTSVPLDIWRHYRVAGLNTPTVSILKADGGTAVHNAITDSGAAEVLTATTDTFRLFSNTANNVVPCILDDVRVYDGDRTTAQSDADYGAPIATPLSAPDLIAYWPLDATSGKVDADSGPNGITLTNSATDSDEGQNFSRPVSGVPPAQGPASPACPVSGEECNPGTCQCEVPAGGAGRTFYVNPSTGDDQRAGTSSGTSWRTLARAMSPSVATHARGGDVVLLENGTYPEFNMHCPGSASSPNAEEGSVGFPITIAAVNERQAVFDNNGQGDVIRLEGCSYVTLRGVRVNGEDFNDGNPCSGNEGHGINVVGARGGVRIERVLVYRSNRDGNSHGIDVDDSDGVTIEEAAIYEVTRHAISIFNSKNCVVRNSYVNGRNRPSTYPAASNCNGQGGVIFYGSANTLGENLIVENIDDSGNAFKHIGASVYDGTTGCRNNRFRNVIAISTGTLYSEESRCWNRNGCASNSIEDGLGLGTKFSHMVYLRNSAFGIAKYLTLIGNIGNGGFYVDPYNGTACTASNCSNVACFPSGGFEMTCNQRLGGNNCGGTYSRIVSLSHTADEINASGLSGTSGTCLFDRIAASGGQKNIASPCTETNPVTGTITGMDYPVTGSNCVINPRDTDLLNVGGTGDEFRVGSDNRCVYVNGERQTQAGAGAASDMFVQTGVDPSDCTSANASGNLPTCIRRFVGARAFVAGVNDVNGSSESDVHERLNLDQTGCTTATACP